MNEVKDVSVYEAVTNQLNSIYDDVKRRHKAWLDRKKQEIKSDEKLLEDVKEMQSILQDQRYNSLQRILNERKSMLRKNLSLVLSPDYTPVFENDRTQKAIGLQNRLDEIDFWLSEPKRIVESLKDK